MTFDVAFFFLDVFCCCCGIDFIRLIDYDLQMGANLAIVLDGFDDNAYDAYKVRF